jgi:septum formation protein
MRTMESTLPVLCLASISPRRQELLAQIGVPHVVAGADIDETVLPGEGPHDYVARMAREKALAIWSRGPEVAPFGPRSKAPQATFDNRTRRPEVAPFGPRSKAPQATFDNRTRGPEVAPFGPRSEALPVLAADTTVVLDDIIYGKPRDRSDGIAMLGELSGRTHEVLTAVALADERGVALRLSASAVRFRKLTLEECAAYWETGEPSDKAGGYAIQGFGAVFIESLNGSYSGVMGLPLFETAELLRAAGVPYWAAAVRAGALR